MAAPAGADSDPRAVAVLYFDDLTPDVLPAYVADGITEDLIDRLSGVKALRVISPNGVRPFRGSVAAIDSIGRALRVGTIVTGSLMRSGRTLRANVRLVDAATGTQLHSSALEREWTELFALQDRLTEDVAFLLRQRLGDEIALRRNRQAAKSLPAWETMQLAGAEMRSALERTVRNDAQAFVFFRRGDSLYRRTQELDPQWDLPLIKRGRLALSMGASSAPEPLARSDSAAYARLRPVERRQFWYGRAISLADSAMQLSPQSAEARALRGDARFYLLRLGTPGSDTLAPRIERDLLAALGLRPDLATAWSALAAYWTFQGRYAEAADAARRAYDADAFFETRAVLWTAFFASLNAEQYPDARQWCRLGQKFYAGDVRFVECQLTLLGWTASRRSDAGAASREFESIERQATSGALTQTWAYRRFMLAAALAHAGMRDSARSVLGAIHADPRASTTRLGPMLAGAYVRLLLNQRDSALVHLEEYVRAVPDGAPQLADHPWFKGLRGDPRFMTLVQSRR